MAYDYDLLVIGAGPAGLSASKQAAQYGAKVAIAEQSHLGGCCVNRGCVPKKLMVYAADFANLSNDAANYGWDKAEIRFSWQRFVTARNQELQRLRQSQERSLQAASIDLINRRASFIDAHTLDIGDRQITADKILVAVGGKPSKPQITGIELALTSDQMFDLEQLPQQVAIIGGGYIGVEFASILHGLGCQVTLLNHESCVLSGFDDDLRLAVQNGLMQRGIRNLCNTTTQSIHKTPEGLRLLLEGDCLKALEVDLVLCATGRVPNIGSLNLEQADVATHNQAIAVDSYSRTSQPNIFAVGDCTDRVQLTPVAQAEGKAFAKTVFGHQPQTVNYDYIPSAVCARPEAAAVGLSETQAQQQYGDRIRCYQNEFQPLFHSLTDRPQKTLIKLVVSESDRVLGVHMVGDHAAEIVQALALSMQKGITKSEVDAAIGIHPSTAEEFFSL
jgi:glutathione reductase (NADPH)